MVSISSLWLPILVSSALVWVASALFWTVLPHHKKDFKKVSNEEAARQALKDLGPGQYNLPHVGSQEELKRPETKRKFDEGPNAFITVLPRGIPAMGRNMVLSFVFYVVIGVFIAYVAGRTLVAGTEYMTVFRLTATVAWLAYGTALIPDAIWFGRPWSAIVKYLIDAMVYALLTAGCFGWLWPDLLP